MTTITGVEMISNWSRDPMAYDPSAIMRWIKIDGVQYTVRSVLGYGWPMSIKHKGAHIGMAEWENWSQVADVVRQSM